MVLVLFESANKLDLSSIVDALIESTLNPHIIHVDYCDLNIINY